MQTGDVIFFKAQDTFISKMIARMTRSDYTHVGLVLDEDLIIESDRFVNTRIVGFTFDENRHTLYRSPFIDDKIKEKIRIEAVRFEQFPYDYLQILKWFIQLLFGWNISFLNRANRLICSELIDYTFIASGLERVSGENIGDVTPEMLIGLYRLKEVDR